MNERVLVARKKQGLSQDQLAEKSGIAQAYISLIEKHGWTPPEEIRERLAEILDTPADELFEGVRATTGRRRNG